MPPRGPLLPIAAMTSLRSVRGCLLAALFLPGVSSHAALVVPEGREGPDATTAAATRSLVNRFRMAPVPEPNCALLLLSTWAIGCLFRRR